MATVDYEPPESSVPLFGGNSNWRGPVWLPVNGLLIRGLLNLYLFYGDDFKGRMPHRLEKLHDLFEVAKEIGRRLSSIFLRDANGKRAVAKKFPVREESLQGGTQASLCIPYRRRMSQVA